MTAPSRRRLRASRCLAALIVVAFGASCSSDDPTEPAASSTIATPVPTVERLEEGVVLRTADGAFELEIPAGTAVDEASLGIEPADAGSIAALEGTTPLAAYRLLPLGLRLPEPVPVTARLPIAGEGAGVPVILAAIERDGLSLLGDQRLARDDGVVVHRAEIDRFGTIVLVDGALRLAIEGQEFRDFADGETVPLSLQVDVADVTLEPWPDYDLEVAWSVSGVVALGQAESIVFADIASTPGPAATTPIEVTCEGAGRGSLAVDVAIDVDPAFAAEPGRQFVTLGSEIPCGEVGRGS